MSELIALNARSIRFWNVGGTGINLARSYRADQPKNSEQLANEQFAYIDTSFSNMGGASEEDFFVINEGKGLGKDHVQGNKIFDAELPNIRARFKPADLNVVTFGLAGGTGATGGRKLLASLLADGHNAIGLVIGSHDSDRATGNTISAMMNMERDVKKVNRPIVISYHENDRTLSLSKNNTAPLFVMRLLSILASGKNKHLDISDIVNFFNYSTVTHHQPALAMLDVFAGEEPLMKSAKNLIAIAALLKSDEDVMPNVQATYDTVGYLPEEGRVFDNSFYYTISTSGLAPTMKKLGEALEEYKRRTKGVEVNNLLSAGIADEGDVTL